MVRVTGQMDVYEAADDEVYWQIPLKSTYHVAWGNGRSFEMSINPMEMNYPTYGCACLVGELIQLVRTPKKARPDELESPPTWER